MEHYDFSGWATRNDLKCSDGRIIRRDAFKHNDGQKVPLVWNHQHNDSMNVLGHALLENREEGVYAYCTFNSTESGENAKLLVEHGDVDRLSIYANQLRQDGGNVLHGQIREVSLVLAGANPGAVIESIIRHGAESDEEFVLSTGDYIDLYHAEEENDESKVEEEIAHAEEKEEPEVDENKTKTAEKDSESDGKTVKEIYESLTEEQQGAVNFIVSKIVENLNADDKKDEATHSEGGENIMKHNVFENDTQQGDVLVHADVINAAIADGKRYGSLKESVLHHAAINNITNIGELFPQDKTLNLPPEWIKEDDSWVSKVMGSVHHTPFSRVRAIWGKLDENEARARGYIKGNQKADIALSVLKRTTQPTTVYIKMAMDRDDVVDISDFDVLAWQKAEMRKQLDKELAQAYLFGDLRNLSSDDKIDEQCIRPILTDDPMFTINYTVTDGTDYHNDFNSASANDSEAKGVIRAAIKSRKGYKGSGKPTFFTTEDLLTELLLIEDQNGRRIYESETALATAMRVKEIVTVAEMEALTDIYGIIVNMADYNTGADKGGSINMFDDFDIDYNQMKYLMETRCSGALVKPYSAIVLKKAAAQDSGSEEVAG